MSCEKYVRASKRYSVDDAISMIFADEDSDIAESYSSSGTDSGEERTSTKNEDITPMVSEDNVILQPPENAFYICRFGRWREFLFYSLVAGRETSLRTYTSFGRSV